MDGVPDKCISKNQFHPENVTISFIFDLLLAIDILVGAAAEEKPLPNITDVDGEDITLASFIGHKYALDYEIAKANRWCE